MKSFFLCALSRHYSDITVVPEKQTGQNDWECFPCSCVESLHHRKTLQFLQISSRYQQTEGNTMFSSYFAASCTRIMKITGDKEETGTFKSLSQQNYCNLGQNIPKKTQKQLQIHLLSYNQTWLMNRKCEDTKERRYLTVLLLNVHQQISVPADLLSFSHLNPETSSR